MANHGHTLFGTSISQEFVMSGVWKGKCFLQRKRPAPASQQGIMKRQRCHLLEVGALALVIQISFCYSLSVFFISSAAELFRTQEQFPKGIGCACVVKDLGLFVLYTSNKIRRFSELSTGILDCPTSRNCCGYQNSRIIACIIYVCISLCVFSFFFL